MLLDLVISAVKRYYTVPSLCVHTGRSAHIKLFMAMMSVPADVAKLLAGARIVQPHDAISLHYFVIGGRKSSRGTNCPSR